MPRHLTNRQKKFIDQLISEGLTDIEQMNLWQYDHIEQINDFETLYQCVENYIWEKRMNGACDETLKAQFGL